MRLLLLLLLVVSCTIASPSPKRPGVKVAFEKARKNLYSMPVPKHDPQLAQRVSDCIAGQLKDYELCQLSVTRFTEHIQEMYLRTSAIHQAEDAGRAVIEELEKAEIKQREELLDTTKIPLKPRTPAA